MYHKLAARPQKPSTFVDHLDTSTALVASTEGMKCLLRRTGLLVSNPRWDRVTGSAAKLCSWVRQMYLLVIQSMETCAGKLSTMHEPT